MIKITYDCKIGVPGIALELTNLELEIDKTRDEENNLFNLLAGNSEEENIKYIYDIACYQICDLLQYYFSKKMLGNEQFVYDADIFDIKNIKIAQVNNSN